MPNRIIDEMPTLSDVEAADAYTIVCLNHYLRPVMSNDELVVVKAIARRYDNLNDMTRAGLVARARREYET
jgi:hypothetical protein